jgi:hypothetical protein
MNNETPRKRVRNPHLGADNTIFVEFTDTGAPLDETRERKGRPERSPSLPPLDEPKTNGGQTPGA